jgi:arylsulfatase A-like enzyme
VLATLAVRGDAPMPELTPRLCRAALLVAAAAGLAPAPLQAGTAPRPNVLVLTVDTLRADRMSFYGYERPTSPNLDRLMREGAGFTQARTIEPLTGPALVSMFTSLYPHQHGASRNGLRMRDGLDSLPRQLREHGYRTAAFVGNWTLKDRTTGFSAHFDTYETVLNRKRWFGLVSSESTADDVTAAALEWLDAHRAGSEGQPFLLWVHFVEPHAPYRLHDEHLEPLGIVRRGDVEPRDRYDTEVAEVDRAVGVLLAGLRERVDPEQTLIAFTSDHGESLGEHDYWGHGRHLFEPTLRIPMSVSWPGRLSPQTVMAPALNIDLAPTVLALLGLRPPASFGGFDWTGVLLHGAEPPDGRQTHYQAHRGAVLSAHDSDLARRAGLLEVAVLHDGVKEIFRVRNGRHWTFRLAPDPSEQQDLSGEEGRPSVDLQDWMREVYSGLNELDDNLPQPLDEETAEHLRALGYTD